MEFSRLRVNMERMLEGQPRWCRELVPYFMNVIDTSEDFTEAWNRVRDAYLADDMKMFYAFFCGNVVMEGQMTNEIDRRVKGILMRIHRATQQVDAVLENQKHLVDRERILAAALGVNIDEKPVAD